MNKFFLKFVCGGVLITSFQYGFLTLSIVFFSPIFTDFWVYFIPAFVTYIIHTFYSFFVLARAEKILTFVLIGLGNAFTIICASVFYDYICSITDFALIPLFVLLATIGAQLTLLIFVNILMADNLAIILIKYLIESSVYYGGLLERGVDEKDVVILFSAMRVSARLFCFFSILSIWAPSNTHSFIPFHKRLKKSGEHVINRLCCREV